VGDRVGEGVQLTIGFLELLGPCLQAPLGPVPRLAPCADHDGDDEEDPDLKNFLSSIHFQRPDGFQKEECNECNGESCGQQAWSQAAIPGAKDHSDDGELENRVKDGTRNDQGQREAARRDGDCKGISLEAAGERQRDAAHGGEQNSSAIPWKM